VICSITRFRNRVPGCNYPGTRTRFQLLSKEKWQSDNMYTPNYRISFTNLCFFTLNVRKWMIKIQMWIRTSTKIVTIAANRWKSKSSHKEIQRQAKIAFFISNECKNRVSITRIWNRVRNFGTSPGTRFLLQITSIYYWWLVRPTITIRFHLKFQIIALLFDRGDASLSHVGGHWA